jgi:predicted hydrocarbon binding protein
MEEVIQVLQNDLRNIIEDKPTKTLREESGDLVDLRALRIVNFSLQWASVGYQSALRFAGMKFGRRLGENSETKELSSLLRELKKLIESLKAGKIEVKLQALSKKAFLTIYESALSAGVPNISQNLCFFEEGFIEGYLDGVIAKQGSLIGGFENITEVEVRETKCQGKGDPFCQFTINLKGQAKK